MRPIMTSTARHFGTAFVIAAAVAASQLPVLGQRGGGEGRGGGQASQDGVLEPEELAEVVIQTLREERFLVLPHPDVLTYFQRKASDYDRWLAGMRRFRRRLIDSRTSE